MDIQQPAPAFRRHDVSFHGRGGEYFGIWAINLLLSIATLGIYSAWAKVRRLRYFYGNTVVDGHALDYHANPIAILKGRLVAAAIIGGFYLAERVYPPAAIAIWLVITGLSPWIINRSLKFHARMTSYRNVRLDFVGTYGGAFYAFVFMPFVCLLPLGLTLPFARRAGLRYLARGYRYGGEPFKVNLTGGQLYPSFLLAVLFGLVGGVVGAFALGFAGPWLVAAVSAKSELWVQVAGMQLTIIGAFAGFMIGNVYFSAATRKVAINVLELEGGHRFMASYKPLRVAWIALSNVFLTVVSLGLLHAWAAVRAYKYPTDGLSLLAASDFGEFASRRVEATSSFGDEFAELQGFEIGI